MKWFFGGLLLLHGLIHLMGFAKAFGYAELPQLTQPISKPMGLTWLVVTGLFLLTVAALFAWPRGWWMLGAAALLASQMVILTSWTDAKFGTVANVIVLAGVVVGFAARGPTSFRAQFEKDVSAALAPVSMPDTPLTEADIVSLPLPVRRYIEKTGALGQPRVRNFHLTFEGRIRGGPEKPWMSFTGKQVNTYGPNARYFLMDAAMYGVPVQAFHRFVGAVATMRVKAASVVPIVDASGPEMAKAETVTLLNDMCVFAPGALVDPRIVWREIDAHNVSASFTNEGITIQATLTFNDAFELTDFVSDDRLAGSEDGKSFTPRRWSTPLRDYASFGSHYLSGYGAGRWHPKDAPAYDYIQLSLKSIRYNVRPEGS
jgi:hypothetical protein